MQPRVEVPVLVVGGGPTGLTLAVDLARRGVACRIIDKSPEPFPGSRGKGLQPRTLEVFEDLGVLERVFAAGGPYPPLRAYAGERVVWEGRMSEHREPTPDVPYPNVWMLPQWRTEELLRERLAGLGGHVEFGTELTALEQDAHGVTATLVHAGSEERVRARYLVGADGGRSFVRKWLGVGFAGETHASDRMLIADVHVEGLDREHWHTWPDAGGRKLRVALCPLPGTDVFQLTVPLAPEDTPELSLESLQKRFAEASGRRDIRLHGPRWVSLYRVNIRRVDRYRVGRVFLAGDAAHVHSPMGGQGLNTGIQDGYNLGWKLGAVLAGAPESLLDTYEEERLPIAAGVLGISTRLYQRSVRGEEEAYRRGSETQQLGLHYRGGSLSRDTRETPGQVRAGDRAPDAPCQDATGAPLRLFETFRGPHFTLLAFGSGHADTVARVNARYGPTVKALAVIDPGGHARTAYDVEGDALVLVRPDGYIGLFARPGHFAEVEDFLRGLLPPESLGPLRTGHGGVFLGTHARE